MKVIDKNFNEINSSSSIEQTINFIKESLEKMNINKMILYLDNNVILDWVVARFNKWL